MEVELEGVTVMVVVVGRDIQTVLMVGRKVVRVVMELVVLAGKVIEGDAFIRREGRPGTFDTLGLRFIGGLGRSRREGRIHCL